MRQGDLSFISQWVHLCVSGQVKQEEEWAGPVFVSRGLHQMKTNGLCVPPAFLLPRLLPDSVNLTGKMESSFLLTLEHVTALWEQKQVAPSLLTHGPGSGRTSPEEWGAAWPGDKLSGHPWRAARSAVR